MQFTRGGDVVHMHMLAKCDNGWADEPPSDKQLDELKHLCRMPVQLSRIRMDVPAPHGSAIQKGHTSLTDL